MAEKKPRAPRKKAEVAPEITAPVPEAVEEVTPVEVPVVAEEEEVVATEEIFTDTNDHVEIVAEVHPTEEELTAALDEIEEADALAEEVIDLPEEEENSRYFARPRNPRLGKLSKWEAVVTEAGKEKVLYTGTEKSAKLVVQQHIRRTNR